MFEVGVMICRKGNCSMVAGIDTFPIPVGSLMLLLIDINIIGIAIMLSGKSGG